MSNNVIMPTLGLTMETGLIVRWLKQEGEQVEQGEELVEIESDKATNTIESDYSGTVLKIYYPEGAEVPCTKTIAVIGEKGESVPETAPDGEPPSEAVKTDPTGSDRAGTERTGPERTGRESPSTATGFKARAEAKRAEKIIATPRARRYATMHNIDLAAIGSGSGPKGRIQERDVVEFEKSGRAAAVDRREAAGAPVTAGRRAGEGADIGRAGTTVPIAPFASETAYEIPVSRMRRTIARRLSESKQSIPHYYLDVSINMEELLKARSAFNTRNPQNRVSLNSLLVKMVSIVVTKHPMVNATWADEKILVYRQVDMGVAVSTEEGLVAPVIRACETKNVQTIHRELQDLIQRARTKELKPEEYEQATFTVSNLGMFDIEQFSAIINPPGSAILALGKVMEQPVGVNGEIVLKPMMHATLSCDHRVIDGAKGAVFMQDLKNTMEIPFFEYFT